MRVPLWAGCVSMAPCAAGSAGVCVPNCVCTPGAVQGVHTCVTRVWVSVPSVPVCAQLGLCAACTCVSRVCQCPLCLCVGDTCRAGLPVSLCQLCTRVLVRVAVLSCACALISILGGSVVPGYSCKSPPLAQCWPVACPWGL